jgi:hypothetical protein
MKDLLFPKEVMLPPGIYTHGSLVDDSRSSKAYTGAKAKKGPSTRGPPRRLGDGGRHVLKAGHPACFS